MLSQNNININISLTRKVTLYKMNMTCSILEQAQIIFVFGNLSSKNIKDGCHF